MSFVIIAHARINSHEQLDKDYFKQNESLVSDNEISDLERLFIVE